jgi:hypothetical protein
MGNFRGGCKVGWFSGLGIRGLRGLAIRMGRMHGRGILLVLRRGLITGLRRMPRGLVRITIRERRLRGIWAIG